MIYIIQYLDILVKKKPSNLLKKNLQTLEAKDNI